MKKKLINCYIDKLLYGNSSNLKSTTANNLTIQQFNNLKTRKGFTLVEIILYMALLAVFLIVLTDIFVSILDIQTESEATSSVEQDSRALLARFNFDIANADSILT